MAINPPYVPDLNNNNPSKELLASSGIYDGIVYSSSPNNTYFPDRTDSPVANTGIQRTTTSTTPRPDSNAYRPDSDHALRITVPGRTPPLNQAMLNDYNLFIDDMEVFNKYIHYDNNLTGGVLTFDPQSFLEQAIVNFNLYSLEYRV